MMMLVVISVDADPEDLPGIIDHIDPPNVPYFSGHVRVAPDPESVKAVIDYLDDDTGPIA